MNISSTLKISGKKEPIITIVTLTVYISPFTGLTKSSCLTKIDTLYSCSLDNLQGKSKIPKTKMILYHLFVFHYKILT